MYLHERKMTQVYSVRAVLQYTCC